jgi:hypothetical protein
MTAILANAGVPMIFWQLPVAVVALLPIVAIESLIAWPILNQRLPHVVLAILKGNAVSAFIGIPLAWIGMLIVNIATTGGTVHEFRTPMAAFKSIVLQASWLIPYEDQLRWLIPAATLVLLVPYFFVSVFVERFWLRRRFNECEIGRVALAAWAANFVTYAGLATYTVIWLASAF